MATRTVKSDSGNDLKLQNNGGTGSVTISDAGDLTIDSPADIVLDAEGADITLKDGGTTFGTLKQASGHLVLQPESSKEIIFNDGSGTASLTVDAANQHVSINNGNLVMGSAGAGIDFAAQTTSATGSPDTDTGDEVLDHYETGDWTPTNSSTPYLPLGRYVRIGSTVHVWGSLTSYDSGDSATSWGGLPFPLSNNVPVRAIGHTRYSSAVYGMVGDANASTFSFYSGYSAVVVTQGVALKFNGTYTTG